MSIRTLVPLVIPLALALVAAACGDGESAPVVPSEERASPLMLRISFQEGASLQWNDLPDETGYQVAGTVRYGPSCDLLGELDPIEMTFAEQLPAGTVAYSLPRADDERLIVLLGVTAEITATGTGASEPPADSIAYTVDPEC